MVFRTSFIWIAKDYGLFAKYGIGIRTLSHLLSLHSRGKLWTQYPAVTIQKSVRCHHEVVKWTKKRGKKFLNELLRRVKKRRVSLASVSSMDAISVRSPLIPNNGEDSSLL